MDLMQDPTFKKKYQKQKLRVKQWESEFMEKFGRRPNKNDIKAADSSIREAYKMYYKLKTRALEETLTDITFYEDTEQNILPNDSLSESIIQTDDKVDVDKEKTPSKDDSENTCPRAFSPPKQAPVATVPDKVNVKGVWGQHLNADEEPPRKRNILLGRSSSFQLSLGKFNSLSAPKRNPRKSASFSKLKKSKEDLSTDKSQKDTEGTEELDFSDLMDSSLNDSLKITRVEKKITSSTTNTIQQLMEKRSSSNTVNKQLNAGWLSRCTGDEILDNSISDSHRLSGNSDSGLESMDYVHSSKESIETRNSSSDKIPSDEEDYVCNSDSEEERKSKRKRNFNKIVNDDVSQPTKRLCVSSIPIGAPSQTHNSVITTAVEKVANEEIVQKLPTDDVPEVFSKYTMMSDNEPEVPSVKKRKSDPIKVAVVPAANTSKDDITDKNTQGNVEKGSYRLYKSKNDSTPEEKKPAKPKRGRPKAKTKTKSTTTYAKSRPQRGAAKKTPADEYNIDSNDEDENKDSNPTDPEPDYNVESLDVVPRVPLNASIAGNNLITSFSRVLGITESKVPEKDVPVQSSSSGKSKLSSKEEFERKVASGNLNENFVRINLKKKVFVRGKNTFNFSKYKKNQWKQKKKELASNETHLAFMDSVDKNNGVLCFKCNQVGHFARQCKNVKEDLLLPLDASEDISSFPTLEEAEQMVKLNGGRAKVPAKIPSTLAAKDKDANIDDLEEFSDWEEGEGDTIESIAPIHKIPEQILEKLKPQSVEEVQPIYDLEPDGSVKDTPLEVLHALRRFGHTSFRDGQEQAIMRILSGQSTLVTLATGSGKSLCYQLPAYMYSQKSQKCITLVVSPLVSLMDDQVAGIPNFLSAACLHTNQTPKLREKIIEDLKDGKIEVLLVSPEAVVAGEKSSGFGSIFRHLPPIAFACIDEAHCISHWSHNFRPSYLMVCRVLRERLGVTRILGLTATASKSTASNIVNLLGIEDGMAGVITEKPLPSNLTLTISRDEQRDEALVRLLLSERFAKCDSVIVYCTRREECTRIAATLRVSLKQFERRETSKKVKVSSVAEAYHAGLSAYKRKQVQTAFMKSETRIIVATVAFGMGINKRNIRSVIHYNMPASFESYVQEIGRAGRDGEPAHCHLFLSPQVNADEYELRRHINAHGIDRHTIRRLLDKIFIPCSCNQSAESGKESRCQGHEVAFPVDDAVSSLDITEETIATLLCYLELHPKRYIKVLSPAYVNAKVASYAGANALKIAAQSSPPLAMAIALAMKRGTYSEHNATVEFPVVDTAATIGWDSGLVKNQLKRLEWMTTADGRNKRSPITVTFDTLGFRVKAPGDLTEDEREEVLEALNTQSQSQMILSLRQLKAISTASRRFSFPSIRQCVELSEDAQAKSEELKTTIRSYFEQDDPLSHIEVSLTDTKVSNEALMANDIRNLVVSYQDNKFTGRSVARIFHGIQSPNYPAIVWAKCRFWREHLREDFNAICELATKEIFKMK